ncbi:hypothetical protein [Mobilicoccus massiliensis]|uniref:hypothetical protein n=1 Tax=Mobilicoccus massiliensis TaxID=1522310 RepID=UPI001C3E8CB1|nr:hypothetical protein [Mobilicoccus massiliensis]
MWTTPAGRTYATTPWDYRDSEPTSPEAMRANHDRLVREHAAAQERQASRSGLSMHEVGSGRVDIGVGAVHRGMPAGAAAGFEADRDSSPGVTPGASVDVKAGAARSSVVELGATRVCGRSIRRVAAATGLSPQDVLADLVAMIENREALDMYDTTGALITTPAGDGDEGSAVPFSSAAVVTPTVTQAVPTSRATARSAAGSGATGIEPDDDPPTPIRIRRRRRRATPSSETPWAQREAGPPPF